MKERFKQRFILTLLLTGNSQFNIICTSGTHSLTCFVLYLMCFVGGFSAPGAVISKIVIPISWLGCQIKWTLTVELGTHLVTVDYECSLDWLYKKRTGMSHDKSCVHIKIFFKTCIIFVSPAISPIRDAEALCLPRTSLLSKFTPTTEDGSP